MNNACTALACWLYAVFSLCHFYNLKLQAIHPFEMKKVTALGATNDMIILIVVPKCTDFEELAMLVELLELVEVADFWKAPQGAMLPLVLERPEIRNRIVFQNHCHFCVFAFLKPFPAQTVSQLTYLSEKNGRAK